MCTAGLGGPHIRQRLYWVADANGSRLREGRTSRAGGGRDETREQPSGLCITGGMAHTDKGERRRIADGQGRQPDGATTGWKKSDREPESRGDIGGQANATPGGFGINGSALRDAGHTPQRESASGMDHTDGGQPSDRELQRGRRLVQLSQNPLAGFWRDADWLLCTDDKARPVEPRPQQMADGFAEGLGRLRPECILEIEKEIADATIAESSSREALRDLWIAHAQEAIRRGSGRCDSLHQAPVLLSFMRQLAGQGWRFLDHLPPACWEGAEVGLRELREASPQIARPPCGSEPGQQRTDKPQDAVSVVSQALARGIEKAWMIPHPLATGAPKRLGRLRGYGNALCAPQAQAFVQAVMGCLP